MTALSITLALVAVVAAALALVAVLAWRRAQVHAVRREEAAERELAALRERLAALERAARPTRAERAAREREYVITRLGEGDPSGTGREVQPAQVSIKAPAFADLVVRETVVHTASWVQGLRRALAAETRHRIRFEMKREIKRSRKARKVEVREALREYRARHRAEVPVATDVAAGEGAA
jgi:hypothetical protein